MNLFLCCEVLSCPRLHFVIRFVSCTNYLYHFYCRSALQVSTTCLSPVHTRPNFHFHFKPTPHEHFCYRLITADKIKLSERVLLMASHKRPRSQLFSCPFNKKESYNFLKNWKTPQTIVKTGLPQKANLPFHFSLSLHITSSTRPMNGQPAG